MSNFLKQITLQLNNVRCSHIAYASGPLFGLITIVYPFRACNKRVRYQIGLNTGEHVWNRHWILSDGNLFCLQLSFTSLLVICSEFGQEFQGKLPQHCSSSRYLITQLIHVTLLVYYAKASSSDLGQTYLPALLYTPILMTLAVKVTSLELTKKTANTNCLLVIIFYTFRII